MNTRNEKPTQCAPTFWTAMNGSHPLEEYIQSGRHRRFRRPEVGFEFGRECLQAFDISPVNNHAVFRLNQPESDDLPNAAGCLTGINYPS